MRRIEQSLADELAANGRLAPPIWKEILKAGVFILQGNCFAYVDHNCEVITGQRRDALVGKPFSNVFGFDAEGSLAPQGGARHDVKGETHRYECRLRTSDGVERWVAGELTRIASDGKPAILGTVFDTTAHKVARAYIEANNPTFEQMFKDGPLGIALVGPDLCFLKVNPTLCEMLGYSAEELTGRFFADHIHPEDVQQSLESARDLVTGVMRCLKTERRYIRKNGEVIWLGVTASSLRDRDNQIICGLVMFEDIGRRKRSEAEKRRYSQQLLNTLEEERRRVARELHDDVGQTLAAVALRLRSLWHDHKRGSEIIPGLRQATNEIEKAAEAVAALAHAYHPAELKNLGLAAALRGFTTSWSRQHGVRVTREIAAIRNVLSAEQELHLYRIVQEAFNNVAKHSGANHVHLTMARTADKLTISVDDNGHGLSGSEIDRHSRGLGITTMKERAQMAGGEVVIKEIHPRGTRVEVVLPLPSVETKRSSP